ncbi:hypothetical protein [Streptomyces sirii]|uniref:hypothetical protein n=1 Tax=Streptomyces sirii TaxID=3127701 RepID=UPI003D35A7B3
MRLLEREDRVRDERDRHATDRAPEQQPGAGGYAYHVDCSVELLGGVLPDRAVLGAGRRVCLHRDHPLGEHVGRVPAAGKAAKTP